MKRLLGVSAAIDRLLGFFASIGGWLGALLVLVVCYDVVTRYFGVPKPFGLNSTMIQESEYWLHSYLIVLVIGYAYIRQAHVRIDLVREQFSARVKCWIEAVGIVLFLVPYSILGLWLSWPYTVASFRQGEISKSQIGLSHIWLLKGGMIVLFLLLFLAALSQLIKAVAGIMDDPRDQSRETFIGEEN